MVQCVNRVCISSCRPCDHVEHLRLAGESNEDVGFHYHTLSAMLYSQVSHHAVRRHVTRRLTCDSHICSVCRPSSGLLLQQDSSPARIITRHPTTSIKVHSPAFFDILHTHPSCQYRSASYQVALSHLVLAYCTLTLISPQHQHQQLLCCKSEPAVPEYYLPYKHLNCNTLR